MSISKILITRYFGDGSGRDSYITHNYGGSIRTKFKSRADTHNFIKHGFRSVSQLDGISFRKSRNGEINDFGSYIKAKQRKVMRTLIERQQKSVNKLCTPRKVSTKKHLDTKIRFIVPTKMPYLRSTKSKNETRCLERYLKAPETFIEPFSNRVNSRNMLKNIKSMRKFDPNPYGNQRSPFDPLARYKSRNRNTNSLNRNSTGGMLGQRSFVNPPAKASYIDIS
ncbi:unnamed protein product [Moneuplotes crassus]|uniref:Uncharacterized protein n=1 Tax=Euplotes crassus TaxID=5936 RepID=A0AAD1XSX5_EUPCR|nr:unnamed protein product [Moneuplotes crassus]